jgi:hypothetical protein
MAIVHRVRRRDNFALSRPGSSCLRRPRRSQTAVRRTSAAGRGGWPGRRRRR